MSNYYLHINYMNLVHYIGRGLILPHKFYKNRTEDIQAKIGDNILLTDNSNYYLNNSTMIIKLEIDDEESLIKEDNNIFLYKKPIPISKIKGIAIKDKNQIDGIISKIEENIGFISKNIFREYKKENKDLNIDNIKYSKYQYDDIMKKYIKLFNTILGAYSLLKVNFCDLKITDLYNFFNDIDKNLLNILTQERIDKNDVETISRKDDIKLTFSIGIYQEENISNKESNTYLIVILFNMINKKDLKIFVTKYLKNEFSLDKESTYKLVLLNAFNENKGCNYSNLNNSYNNIQIKLNNDDEIFDKVFSYCFNQEKNLKIIDGNKQEIVKDIIIEDETIIEIKKYVNNIINLSIKDILDIPKNLLELIKKISDKLKKKDEEIQQLQSEKEALNSSKNKEIENLKLNKIPLNYLTLDGLKELSKRNNINHKSNIKKEDLINLLKSNNV